MAGLQYSDTTNKLGLLQDCEFSLNFQDGAITTDTSYLKPTITRLLNIWYQKIITMIFASQDGMTWDDSNASDYPIATTSLVANQQDYQLPVSLNLLRVQTVNVSYDGGTTWHRASPFNKNESIQPLDTTDIADNFTIANPFYSIENNALFLYPLPTANSTNGLKIWFQRGPLEFNTSDTTKQPGIDPAFHGMISCGASMDYAITKNLPQKEDLKQKMADWEARLRVYYGSKDQDTNLQLTPIYNDTYGS